MSRPKVWRCVKKIFWELCQFIGSIHQSSTPMWWFFTRRGVGGGGFARPNFGGIWHFNEVMTSIVWSLDKGSPVWRTMECVYLSWKKQLLRHFHQYQKISKKFYSFRIFTDKIDGKSDYILLSIVGMLNKTWLSYEVNFLYIVL